MKRRLLGNGEEEIKKIPRAQRERKHRIFNYRGFTFFITIKPGGSAAIAMLDPTTNTAIPQAQVPVEVAQQACYELAKIGMAEEALARLTKGMVGPIAPGMIVS